MYFIDEGVPGKMNILNTDSEKSLNGPGWKEFMDALIEADKNGDLDD